MKAEITIKKAIEPLFNKIKFNDKLYKEIMRFNTEFITKDNERKSLFSSRLIGCQYVKYTHYDKAIFYSELFDLDYDEVNKAVNTITTVDSNFKVARDDINLTCMYIAHRFLNNSEIDSKKRVEYAEEIVKYMCYRSLIVLVSKFFIYPIPEDKAQSLIEHLSYKYIIKKVKNWKEYCEYRVADFIESKNLESIRKFNNDEDIVLTINEIFNKIKDTLKNIYGEMLKLEENTNIIKSSNKVVIDAEGEEVILDKLDSPESYIHHIESCLSDKSNFITTSAIEVSVEIVSYISQKNLLQLLELIYDYAHKGRESNEEVRKIINNIILLSLDYLHRNRITIEKNSNLIKIIDLVIGSLLYNRHSNEKVNDLKESMDNLIYKLYKENKVKHHEKMVLSVRNSFFIYILIKALLKI